MRMRARKACGCARARGETLWSGPTTMGRWSAGRWSAGEKNRKGKLSVWLRGGSSGLCLKSRLASANRELAAPAHHEHTLAVFFYLSAANHPGVRLLLKSPIWDASTPYALYAFYHPCKR